MLVQKSNTMRVLMALLAVMFLIQTFGCVGKKNTSQTLFASLASATAVYNSTHDLVTELGAQGKLDKDQKVKIKAIMVDTEKGLLAANTALDSYVKDSTNTNKLGFEAHILTINQLIIEITKIIGED